MRRVIPVLSISLSLAVAAVLWLDVGGGGSGSGAASADHATAVRPDSAEPRSAPVRYTPDAAGARDAAVAAVAMTDDVVRAGFISRRDLIQSFTTDSFGERLAEETSEQVTDLLLELGQRDVPASELSLVEQPVAANVASFADLAASIDVWSVLVIAADGAGPARQIWRTVTVDLLSVDGEWLVDDWHSELGPTPMLTPDVEISGAADVGAAISWSVQERG